MSNPVGVEIKRIRRLRGLRQKDLALAAGMTQSRIATLESPAYPHAATLRVLSRVAAALGATLVVGFDLESPPDAGVAVALVERESADRLTE
jgi:transcriptional regulator with XRE-family HTH domain